MAAETTPPLSDALKPWGGHSSCDRPAGYLLRGLWVSGLLPPGNGGTKEGAATLKPTKWGCPKTPGLATQRGSGPNCHSSPRRGTLQISVGSVCAQRRGGPRTPVHKKGGGPRTRTEWRRGAFSLLQSFCGKCCAVAILIALEVKFPVSPVSLGDGELRWTGLFFTQWYGYKFSLSTRPRTLSRFEAPLVPSRIEGIRPDESYAVHQMLSLLPCTVTASEAAGHNRGEVAETPPLARTQGRTVGCIFTFPPPRTVAGWFFQ